MKRLFPLIIVLVTGMLWAATLIYRSTSEPHAYVTAGEKAPLPASLVKSSTHGAIAMSTATSVWGSTTGAPSKADALQEAIDRCAKAGATDCKNKVWVMDGCVALAISPRIEGKQRGASGSGSGDNIALVEQTALRNCTKRASDCQIVESFCTYDKN